MVLVLQQPCLVSVSSLFPVIVFQLFVRDPSKRLGVVDDIRLHPFFKSINWTALAKREVNPPFRPRVVCGSHVRIVFSQCFLDELNSLTLLPTEISQRLQQL